MTYFAPVDHLVAALDALGAVHGHAYLRGQPMPDGATELVVLDHLTSTPAAGYDDAGDNIGVQVTCWAETYERALELEQLTRAALERVGFRRGLGRPAPRDVGDPLRGSQRDYRRNV